MPQRNSCQLVTLSLTAQIKPTTHLLCTHQRHVFTQSPAKPKLYKPLFTADVS